MTRPQTKRSNRSAQEREIRGYRSNGDPIHVFISYSHDSEVHKERVLELAQHLQRDGVDCILDQYVPFPEQGWLRWMADQIEFANYVLVICTETYKRRASGREATGHGLGASWEGQLITQEVYARGGRNSKFVPVIFAESDAQHVPAFLASATRFCPVTPKGYEDLFRLLTAQPAVIKPPLGSLRRLFPVNQETESSSPWERISEFDEPVVIWRLPRGFILLTHLERRMAVSWATIASYFDYQGQEIYATHYHESYRWWDKYEAFDMQCGKLHVPRGDWPFACAPLYFMVDVREGKYVVSHDGAINGQHPTLALQDDFAAIFPPGNIPLPVMPTEYQPLAISGLMRDLAAEADDLLKRLFRKSCG